ncbi:MAG: hypothetical protein SF052_15795 [Bacteroidia bacterium]|nr:hypothetical protein [Bacteroidia bacterium]
MHKIKLATDGNNNLGNKIFPIVRPWNTEYQTGTKVTLCLGGAEVGEAEIVRGIKMQNLAAIPEIVLMLTTGSIDTPAIRDKLDQYYKAKIDLTKQPFGIYLLKRLL